MLGHTTTGQLLQSHASAVGQIVGRSRQVQQSAGVDGDRITVGGLAAPGMLGAVADLGVDYVAMHWRGHSEVMQQHTDYTDVVADVAAELAARRDAALAAGIAAERIILDPGIGFAKTSEQNWQLLRGLDVLQAMGHRLLVGVSRKRFLGELLDGRPATDRDAATAAVTTWCSLHGIWAVRTHEVPAQRDAARVGWRLGARAAG